MTRQPELVILQLSDRSASLPADVSDSPALADLAPSSALEKTESLECMLRPTSEVMALDDDLGVVTPYMDPVLGGDRQCYIVFVRGPRLSRSSLLVAAA